jgi:hypothetical protein
VREQAVERSRTQARVRQQAQERRQQLKQRQAQPGPQKPAAKQLERGQRRPDIAGKRQPQGVQPAARVQATDQQRREVRERLFRDRHVPRIARSQFKSPLTIGSHVSRRHRLHRFTPALLALVPMYAAYSYLVVDDTICVVDPDTYAIVDVIPSSIEQAGPPAGASGSRLALSTQQMRCIYASVPKDQGRVDLRIRLALGAEIPRDVKLASFPEGSLSCSRELVNLGYVVVDDDVVIVDPADYAILQVISK